MATAIITGASRGFGLALAADLATDGWDVIADARDGSHLRRALAGLGERVIAVPGDVTDSDHRERLVGLARKTGNVELLVNNASSLGASPLPPLAAYPMPELEIAYRTNVFAPLALAQLALPMLAAAGGAVVNVTSDAAVEAYPGWGGYGSSKAALEQLSAVMAVEEPGVRVWWFDPGDMRTQMHQDAFPGEDISDRTDPTAVVPALRQIVSLRPPSGRIRAAEVLAGAAT